MAGNGRVGTDSLLKGSRIALIAGFGGLLIAAGAAGVDALLVLRNVRAEDNRTRTEFLSRNHLLNDIRSKLYLSGTHVRDFLLDPDPARADGYRASLREVRGEIDSELETLRHRTTGSDSSQVQALQSELADYWLTIGPALDWDAPRRHRDGYSFIRDTVLPRRAAMLNIAGRVDALNEQQLNDGNAHLVQSLNGFQTRLTVGLLLTLALGATMAVFSARRILRLESDAEARYNEVAEARVQLANLSARLVNVQETERRALSRELHDEVGQNLSAALVELRNLTGNLRTFDSAAPSPRTDVIRELIEDTLRATRDMSLLLRPSMLDDLGLEPALRWQAREVSKRTGMDVTVEADALAELPDEHKTCIYRVIQEALHNCASHSEASRVQISVRRDGDWLRFSVRDDGRGYDPAHSRGLGMLGMEERVGQLGGALHVSSAPGRGTTLDVSLPYPGVTA